MTRFLFRWWPFFAWLAFIGFVLCNGCIGNPHVILPCDDDNCGKQSSLAPPAIVGWHKMKDADKALIRMLLAMAPETGPERVTLVSDFRKWQYRVRDVSMLVPGGFILVKGDWGEITEYFKNRRWDRMPFLWKDHQIWRKPLRSQA